MKNKSESNYIEAEYKEIHIDENGNEYLKGPVMKAVLLKMLPYITAFFILVFCVSAYAGIPLIICCAAVVILLVNYKNIKKQIINYLLKTNRYYDNRT